MEEYSLKEGELYQFNFWGISPNKLRLYQTMLYDDSNSRFFKDEMPPMNNHDIMLLLEDAVDYYTFLYGKTILFLPKPFEAINYMLFVDIVL